MQDIVLGVQICIFFSITSSKWIQRNGCIAVADSTSVCLIATYLYGCPILGWYGLKSGRSGCISITITLIISRIHLWGIHFHTEGEGSQSQVDARGRWYEYGVCFVQLLLNIKHNKMTNTSSSSWLTRQRGGRPVKPSGDDMNNLLFTSVVGSDGCWKLLSIRFPPIQKAARSIPEESVERCVPVNISPALWWYEALWVTWLPWYSDGWAM